LCHLLTSSLMQAEALHYDKRSLDKLLQHRQAELDSTHARLKAALVRASSPHTPSRRTPRFKGATLWLPHALSANVAQLALACACAAAQYDRRDFPDLIKQLNAAACTGVWNARCCRRTRPWP